MQSKIGWPMWYFGLEHHSGFSVVRSLVEHWLLKPGIVGLIRGSWWLFYIKKVFILCFQCQWQYSYSSTQDISMQSFAPDPSSEWSGANRTWLHTIPLSQNSCQWWGVGQPCSHTDRKTEQSPQEDVSACHSSNRSICPALNSAIWRQCIQPRVPKRGKEVEEVWGT